MDQQTTEYPRRKLLIGIGAAVGLIFLIAVITYAIFGLTKRETPVVDASKAEVVTKNEVKENLDDLSTSIKQAETAQTASKAALKDNEKQIKVGS